MEELTTSLAKKDKMYEDLKSEFDSRLIQMTQHNSLALKNAEKARKEDQTELSRLTSVVEGI